jgi:curved DNA-binding protein CbpA
MSSRNNYSNNDYSNFNYDYNFDSNSKSKSKSNLNNIPLRNKNLYEILGLKVNCTKEEIKKAYKKLILKYHPDKKYEKTSEKFLEIKNAFDILNDNEKRQYYDKTMIINNFENVKNIYGIYNINNLTKDKIKLILLNFIDSTDINKIIIIMIKKNILNNYNNLKKIFSDKKFIKNIIDIDIDIDFTLYDLWYGIPKNINLERVTKKSFNELIFPFDTIQIYENEGEKIRFNNNIINGDINIKINITNMKINNEQYYIYNEELYLIINSNRIKKNKFIIKFIDNNKYKFNLNKLNQIENNLGKFYVKKKFGLLNTDIEYLNNIDNTKSFDNTKSLDNIKSLDHGNLFFIIVL